MLASKLGSLTDPNNQLYRLFDINGLIQNDELIFSIGYPQQLFESSLIENLCQQFLTSLHLMISEAGSEDESYTPSDFRLVDLTQQQLDEIHNHSNIEAIYPLTPMQV